MIEFFLISRIFVVLIVIFGLWLGFWVLFSDKKAKVNQFFFLMTISIVLWNIFAYLGFFTTNVETSVTWYRLSGGAISLFFLATYYFTQYFPQEKKRNNLLNYFVIIITSLFFIISIFTDLVTKNVEIKEWGAEIIFGNLGGIIGFKGFGFLLTIIIFTYFLKKYFYLSIKEKLKAQYFLIGMLIFALFNVVFNIIFPLVLGTVKYQHLGDFSSIFFLGFTAYAIVKRQLFGIKVALMQLLAVVMGIIFLVLPFVMTTGFLRILTTTTFLLFCVFAYYLIKATHEEAKRREEVERIAALERDLREKAEKMAEKEASEKIKEREIREKAEKLTERERFLKEQIGKIVLEQKKLTDAQKEIAEERQRRFVEKELEIVELKKKIAELEAKPEEKKEILE